MIKTVFIVMLMSWPVPRPMATEATMEACTAEIIHNATNRVMGPHAQWYCQPVVEAAD